MTPLHPLELLAVWVFLVAACVGAWLLVLGAIL